MNSIRLTFSKRIPNQFIDWNMIVLMKYSSNVHFTYSAMRNITDEAVSHFRQIQGKIEMLKKMKSLNSL